jgi:hypothetical protein
LPKKKSILTRERKKGNKQRDIEKARE